MIEQTHFSLKDVATMLGVEYRTILRLVQAGEIPSFKIGRVLRVSKAELDSYLERNRTKHAVDVLKDLDELMESEETE